MTMVRKKDILLGIGILAFLFLVLLVAVSTIIGTGNGIVGDHVRVIEVTGPIIDSYPVTEKLEKAIENDYVKAVLVRLDTPGGGVAASQEIYESILEVRESGKKVVASMGSVAASGGYYIAAACDTIVALPGTITGSIGVIINFADFSALYDKIGIDFTNRKSGKYKDVGSTSRPLTDEEKALIDSVVMDTYDQFISAISECRDMDPEDIKKYADGRIFTGRQAKEYGFVDEIGTYRDALDITGTMCGLGEDPPVYRDQPSIWHEFLDGGAASFIRGAVETTVPRTYFLVY